MRRDFETYYAKSMPTRRHETSERVENVLYFARSKDLTRLTKEMMLHGIGSSGTLVKYIAAPPGFGKSACVLPLFLESLKGKNGRGFTHYLYLTFQSSNSRSFFVSPPDPDKDIIVAEMQEAKYIFNCLKFLLEILDTEGTYEFRVYQYCGPVEKATGEISDYFRSMLGPDYKCLIHLDDHRILGAQLKATQRVRTAFTLEAL